MPVHAASVCHFSPGGVLGGANAPIVTEATAVLFQALGVSAGTQALAVLRAAPAGWPAAQARIGDTYAPAAVEAASVLFNALGVSAGTRAIAALRAAPAAWPAVTASAGGAAGFPDATNTGYLHAPGYPGSLTPYGGAPTGSITSNSVYNFLDFGWQYVGSTGTHVSNVTFNGCRFSGSGGSGSLLVALFGDNITFNYCTICPPAGTTPPVAYNSGYQYGIVGNGTAASVVQQLTVDHCDVWGFGNAIDVSGGTQAKPHRFTNNWIHDARADGGVDHTDGLGAMASGSEDYMVITGNRIESYGNTQGLAWQATPGPGTYTNVTCTGNLFGGFGKCIAFQGTVNNITFTDNVFSTRVLCQLSPLYNTLPATSTGSLWRRNRWQVPAGAAWGNPAHDGWYWIPNAQNQIGGDDTPFVSLTDYTG